MLKRMKRNTNKKLKFLYCMLFLGLSNLATVTVQAGSIEGSKAVTGTVALTKAITTALTVVAVPVAGVLIAWQFFKLKGAEDEAEERSIRKKMKTIIIGGAGVFVGSGLTTIILGFYK